MSNKLKEYLQDPFLYQQFGPKMPTSGVWDADSLPAETELAVEEKGKAPSLMVARAKAVLQRYVEQPVAQVARNIRGIYSAVRNLGKRSDRESRPSDE